MNKSRAKVWEQQGLPILTTKQIDEGHCKPPTSSAADLLTKSVVVIATAAWWASEAVLPSLLASLGTERFKASIFIGLPITPVESRRTSSALTAKASPTAFAEIRQS